MPYLVVTMDGKELYRRELTGPVTLGRSTDCDLWLNDAGVSRRHCRFEQHGDAWEVVDLGSRNGIVLHGERIMKHTLRDGDAIHVGAARVTFHAVAFRPSRPTRPATPQGVGDSISDTVISANAASHMGRALPMPRATKPNTSQRDAATPAARLAFTRPPARPIPAASTATNGNGKSREERGENGERRESLLRRLLHI